MAEPEDRFLLSRPNYYLIITYGLLLKNNQLKCFFAISTFDHLRSATRRKIKECLRLICRICLSQADSKFSHCFHFCHFVLCEQQSLWRDCVHAPITRAFAARCVLYMHPHVTYPASIYITDHNRSASEMPSGWLFAGGPIVARCFYIM